VSFCIAKTKPDPAADGIVRQEGMPFQPSGFNLRISATILRSHSNTFLAAAFEA
jgi:hypothetical protein